LEGKHLRKGTLKLLEQNKIEAFNEEHNNYLVLSFEILMMHFQSGNDMHPFPIVKTRAVHTQLIPRNRGRGVGDVN
jgi:hypothetical protein